MNFPDKFYEHLETANYTEIKGGLDRDTFLEIWVVSVNKRVFARSWNKSARSWFTAFLNTGLGQLKYGDKILNVSGKKLNKDEMIQGKIDKAYVSRYTRKDEIFYAEGITNPEYTNYTMEFFYTELNT